MSLSALPLGKAVPPGGAVPVQVAVADSLPQRAAGAERNPLRVVVVSGRRLSRSALAGAVSWESAPADVVAQVDRVDTALGYCQNGEADAVIVDASAMVCEPLADLDLQPDSLHAAMARSSWLGHALAGSLSQLPCVWRIDSGQVACLTPREREVLALLSMGLSNRHMARLLGVTERTIKTHVGRVLAKLGLESRLQAGLAAFLYCALEHAGPARQDPAALGSSQD